MKVFSLLASAPKRVGMFLAVLFAAVALPINSVMAAEVVMEGSIGVANQTTGETTYKPATNAKYDEVVKFSVYYHNRELANSGRVAENFKIKVDMPTKAGKSQVVKVTMKGSNTNTVTDTATVNLNRADARIEFIPGSVYWKHNVGTRNNVNLKTEKIADSIILNGAPIENVKPCHEFEATVTFMARVIVPSVSITKQVRTTGGQATVNLATQPNARIEYLITVKNLGNEKLENVMINDKLPAGIVFVPGTVKLFNGPNPQGAVIANDYLFKGGVNAGSMGPGATVYVSFEATVVGTDKLACGKNTLVNTAAVDTDQTGPYNNTATVTVNKDCVETQQSAQCDTFTVTKTGTRQVTMGVTYTVKDGATFKGVTYDFGDGTTPLVTDKVSGVTHTYAADGEYNLVATLRFSVNGADKTDTCEAKVVFAPTETPETPETPTSLPDTGAGAVVGLFAATSVAGAAAYQAVRRRML